MTKDLTEGLVLDLDMETLQDYSGNSNNGTATGTTLTTDKDGRKDKARSFVKTNPDLVRADGVVSSMQVAGASFALWINTAWSTAPSQVDISFADVSGNEGVMFFNAPTVTGLDVIKNGVRQYYQYFNTSTISAGWHRFLFTHDGTESKIYMDGVDTNAPYYSIGGTGKTVWLNDLTLIDAFVLGSRYYLGSVNGAATATMSGVKCWNRYISPEEAQQDYAEVAHNYVGLFDGMVAGYDFNKDAKDFSGNGHDGTLVNSPTVVVDEHNIEKSAYQMTATSSQYINLGDMGINGACTFGGRFYLEDSGSGSQYLMSNSAHNSWANVGFSLNFRPTNYGATKHKYNIAISNAGGTGIDVLSASVYTSHADTWRTVIGVFDPDNNKLQVYADGVLVIDQTTTINTTATDPYPWAIGREWRTAVTNYRDAKASFAFIFPEAKSADWCKAIHDRLSKGDIHPYPQQRQNGVLE